MLKVCKRVLSVSLAAMMSVSMLFGAQMPSYAQGESGELTFTDDFSAYNAENSAYGSANKITGDSENKVVAANGKIKYVLSGVNRGYSDGTKHSGYTNIAESGKLAVQGWGTARLATNVRLDDNINEFNGFSVDISEINTQWGWDGGKYIRFMMNDAENTYYEIGITDWDGMLASKPADATWSVNTAKGNHPYFRKVVNGTSQSLKIADISCGNGYPVTAEVRISDTAINYSIKNLTGDETFISGTEVIDSAMPRNGESSILSLGALKDHIIGYDNLKLYYTSYGTPGYTEDFSDCEEKTVAMTPANSGTLIAGSAKGGFYPSAKNVDYASSAAYVKDGKLGFKSAGSTNVMAANLNLAEKAGSFEGIELDMKKEKHGRTFVRFMVNREENTYYELGTTGWNSTDIVAGAGDQNMRPYFMTVVNGKRADLTVGDETFPNYWTTTTYKVKIHVNGGNIEYSLADSARMFKGSVPLSSTVDKLFKMSGSHIMQLGLGADDPVEYDNIKIWYTPESAPGYTEDFTDCAANTVKMTKENSNTLIAGSAEKGGFYPSAIHACYPDFADRAAAYVKDGKIGFKSNGWYVMAANLRLPEKIYSLNGIELDMIKVSNGRAFVRFMVNPDEDTYYELGLTSWKDTGIIGATGDGGDNVAGYPYLLKCEEGTSTVLHVGSEQYQTGTYRTRIDIEDGVISYFMTGNGKVFEGTETVSAKIESNFRFEGAKVMQIGTGTDDASEYDNIRVWYTPSIAPSYTDNKNGTVTVSFVPAVLGAASDNVCVIYAHYDSDGRLTEVLTQSVAASKQSVTELSFDKPTAAGASGKLMFWDGGIASAAPLCGALDVD